jgi:hypothetical protein
MEVPVSNWLEARSNSVWQRRDLASDDRGIDRFAEVIANDCGNAGFKVAARQNNRSFERCGTKRADGKLSVDAERKTLAQILGIKARISGKESAVAPRAES